MRHLTQPSHTHNSKQWFSPRAAGRVQPSLSDVWFLVRVLYTEPRRSVSEEAALTCRAERVSLEETSSTDHIVEGLLQERAGAGGLAANARLPPRQAGRAARAQQHRAVGVAPAGEGGARPAQTVGDRAAQLQYKVRAVQWGVCSTGETGRGCGDCCSRLEELRLLWALLCLLLSSAVEFSLPGVPVGQAYWGAGTAAGGRGRAHRNLLFCH